MSAGQRRAKNGPARQYDDAELEYFARHVGKRAPFTPTECDRGGEPGLCWVAIGPPAISPSGKCLGCGGIPKGLGTRGRPTPRKYPGHFQ